MNEPSIAPAAFFFGMAVAASAFFLFTLGQYSGENGIARQCQYYGQFINFEKKYFCIPPTPNAK